MRIICIFISLMFPVCEQTSRLRDISFTYEEQKSWEKAQNICREEHTDLVTIRNAEENQQLGDSKGWIGLYREDETHPWKWSRGDKDATYENWENGEPNNLQSELCTTRRSDGEWENNDCQNTHKFICYDEKLVLVTENKTWEEALDHCRSLGGEDSKHSYDMASLITEDDHDYARERAQQAFTDEVWTGLRFLGDGWFWVSGEPVEYPDMPSCPAFGCGVLEKKVSTSFGIRSCSQRRNFFCSKRPEN